MRMNEPIPLQPGTNPGCGTVKEVLGRMGDKWTILAITMLVEQPRRFNELKRLIGEISQQMLTRTLKALERDGMVTRKVHPSVDRKSTRLNSSHMSISYAVFCLKKK